MATKAELLKSVEQVELRVKQIRDFLAPFEEFSGRAAAEAEKKVREAWGNLDRAYHEIYNPGLVATINKLKQAGCKVEPSVN